MANGVYGIRKPANITVDDIDIYYHYRPTRGSESSDFKGFVKVQDPRTMFFNTSLNENSNVVVSGLYNLRLPLEIFGRKGIYTIYITPRETFLSIVDVSTLTGNFSNVRGVVFNMPDSVNGGLVGSRIEFLDSNGNPTGEYRIITSNNRCEPVSQNTSSSSIQKGVRYRFNDSSDLVFCTVTPSSSPSFKSTAFPYIGKTGESVKLVNTLFNPVAIEVEMTDHDIDTVSTMLEGAQIRNLDNGIITTFDADGNIYHQAAYGNIVNPNEGLHSDFKLPYTNTFVSSEQAKFEEISNQVNNA